jgi:cytochrome P450
MAYVYLTLSSAVPHNLPSVFNETLRLFPPVSLVPPFMLASTNHILFQAVGIPKQSGQDNILMVHSTSEAESKSIPVPKGTTILMDIAGMHYNPRYWPDPYAFRPERFLGDWPRDYFLPFSSGECLSLSPFL